MGGKAKKQKPQRRNPKPYVRSTPGISKHKPAAARTASTTQAVASSTIPFEPHHKILLVGEGDFSFSKALLEHHGCSLLTATSFDPRAFLLPKYAQAAPHIEALSLEKDCKILYGIDATKLGKGGPGSGGKAIKHGGFDRIVFNFPHVGGLTKDMHRQIRHNQELLLGFLKAAQPLLAKDSARTLLPPTGKIIVTLFEGEPYQQWNLRGLARDTGLKIERSFRFQAAAYPGYKHARTLGNIEHGGSWKGEERQARSFILAVARGIEAQAKENSDSKNESDDD